MGSIVALNTFSYMGIRGQRQKLWRVPQARSPLDRGSSAAWILSPELHGHSRTGNLPIWLVNLGQCEPNFLSRLSQARSCEFSPVDDGPPARLVFLSVPLSRAFTDQESY
ncbi:uncharacterized protein APUU_41004A [Aspergillus puulaauensis]|uniref:Uncharacterized protein n=1 Tax=Aspergillus puulaauensis TaxID=1220207 RepID=A0A7R7XN55_9EURO|nr:uncharacterized protein APUU_41004A [Aspergillus puulaauensis]BCS24560.1 hypothetical protein APUU_41004A [Aspergillus puulaauensis]